MVVESPPGFAKSSTIDQALESLGIDYFSVGSYTTPLNLFHVLCDHSSKMVILDDCAGLFQDVKSMALLKAATWSSAGGSGERRISWGSTSERVQRDITAFTGKLILLTNAVPSGKEAQAFLSRTLAYRISFEPREVQCLLFEAAKSKGHYPNSKLAEEVARYLADGLDKRKNAGTVNLRTLQMGYELAQTHPEGWKSLMEVLLPSLSPEDLVERLANGGATVKEQEGRFVQATGLSRRTFFNYRKKQGLVRGP